MALHIQKNNKVLSLLLPFVLACCLLCVSFPTASAASSDEGLTDGRFILGSSPMDSNIERVFYAGSDHCYLRFGQIGDFSDGSSFSPFLSSGYFVSSGDGFVNVSYPAFEVTIPRSGGPTPTSASTFLSGLALLKMAALPGLIIRLQVSLIKLVQILPLILFVSNPVPSAFR